MSQTSLGMGSGLDEANGSGIMDTENLTPEGGSPPGEVVYDYIAYIIYCGDHERIALTRALKQNQLRAVWLPFVALSSIGTWRVKAEEGVQLILKKEDPELEGKMGQNIQNAITDVRRLQLHRIQIPVIRKFITRLIYFVRLEKSPDFKCCENTKRIQWYSLNDAINGKIDKVWGPELKQLAHLCKRPKSQGISEYTLTRAFINVAERDKVPQNLEEEMLRQMGYGMRAIEYIYADYLEHCFPCSQMITTSFKDYLIKNGYNIEERKFVMLFNAFDYEHNGYIEFHQLLLGLVMMEPTLPHREFRVAFVFRYYDLDHDGYLNQVELTNLIKDTFPTDDNETIKQKTKDWFRIMNVTPKGTANTLRCSYEEFSTAVGSLKLRGTSKLCRLPESILGKLSKSMSSRETIRPSNQKITSKLMDKLRDKPKEEGLGPCGQCRIKKYEYAINSVVFNTRGQCVDPHILLQNRETDTLRPARTYSTTYVFPQYHYIGTVILQFVQDFHFKMNKTKDIKGFFVEEKEDLAHRHLPQLCSELEQIFSAEERVIRINGPTYVFGDIYGNLNDLIAMQSILWPSFPVVSANYVFLGNYVDYGKWGVECVIYLLSLKLLSPNKVFLLRGRHEIRDIQIQNTFQKECVEKYEELCGKKIWQMINNLFDRMPFALVVDETIFCSNSGIPNTRVKVQDFNKIAPILKNPSVDSPLVWQLLNNEPTEHPLKRTGVGQNQGNGPQFLVNEVTINAFLEDNSFTHIICGNRQTPNGYGFQFGAKVITVFSTTNFKKSNNKSAALLLSNHKIRVIRLESEEDNKTVSDIMSVAVPTLTS